MKLRRVLGGLLKVRLAFTLVVACCSTAVLADPVEPTPSTEFRDLRDDYVETWYIFNDSQTDGILNPGDTHVDTFQNWWTPVSAHTQHNYDDGPYGSNAATFDMSAGEDQPSAPMNFASSTDPSSNYWLPRVENAIGFYLTYSQYDNNDFSTFYDGWTLDPTELALLKERNMERNGWALGWLVNDINYDPITGVVTKDNTTVGTVSMDILVHDGQGTMDVANFGTNRSDPQVSMSNDISDLADDGAQWHPPTYDPVTGTYSASLTANQLYQSYLGLTPAECQEVVDSLSLRELDPTSAAFAAAAIAAARTPQQLLTDGVTDHTGVNPYLYQDVFTYRSAYAAGSTDGGVIAGLLGQSSYDPGLNNWGDQQVIRIDIDANTFLDGQITQLIFYDFGDTLPGSGAASDPNQVNPRFITFGVDTSQTVAHGQIYYDGPSGRIWFVENRIYIARVEAVPEPASMLLLALGGGALLARRRRALASLGRSAGNRG